MSDSITVPVASLSKGMTADVRDTSGKVKLSKHFDVLTRPSSLTPYHSQVTADAAAATNQMVDFIYYGTNGALYGRGVDGSGNTQILKTTSLSAPSWAATANSTGTQPPQQGCFIEYHGRFYGIDQSGKVWKYDPFGGSSFGNDEIPGAIATVPIIGGVIDQPQGVVHSKDDILYMAVRNVIASNNAGTWVNPALTLPTQYTITAMCEYGDYLAIACVSAVPGQTDTGRSIVYLWDRDSTLNTISEVIDFGYGELRVLDQVEGELIGVSYRQDLFSSFSNKFIFRRYSGGQATTFQELLASSSTGLTLVNGRKFNANRLYFLAGITIDGVLHNGIWGVGKDASGRWIVWFDRLPNNDTAIAANSLRGFFMLGDYALISYTDGGYNLTMTSSSGYTGSSIIETTINPDMPAKHRFLNKQLIAIGALYETFPTGGQVTVKWKVDGGTWNTARTETDSTEIIISEIPSTEASYTSGREYQFRIESTGGVVLTGLTYKYEVLTTLL